MVIQKVSKIIHNGLKFHKFKIMTKETTYKPNETYNILKSLVEANDTIMKAGGVPVSVSLVGTPGLGKTTICRELAADLNRDFFKLNLAQLTEPSELIGYYSKEYEVKKADDVKWVTENLLTKFTEDGFEYTGEVRTRPCPPDWVVSLKEGGILLLDDY